MFALIHVVDDNTSTDYIPGRWFAQSFATRQIAEQTARIFNALRSSPCHRWIVEEEAPCNV